MKCQLKIEDSEFLRVQRFKKVYPEACDISDTTILGFLDAEQRVKISIDKELDKILMLN